MANDQNRTSANSSIRCRVQHGRFNLLEPSKVSTSVYIKWTAEDDVNLSLPADAADELRELPWHELIPRACELHREEYWISSTGPKRRELEDWFAVDDNQAAVEVAWARSALPRLRFRAHQAAHDLQACEDLLEEADA